MQIIRTIKYTFLIAGRETMNWTQKLTKHKVRALGRVCIAIWVKRPAGGKREKRIMIKNKNIGVCLGILGLALGIVGAPAARAHSWMAEPGGTGGGTETITASASVTPDAPSSAESAKKNDESIASATDVPQDQGAPTPANPPQAATPAANAAAPAPLPSPSMTGPLATAVPHEIAAGPFGKINVTGILSGMGWTE